MAIEDNGELIVLAPGLREFERIRKSMSYQEYDIKQLLRF